MEKKNYIKPGIESLCATDELMLGFVETSSIPFGETHEEGGSGIVLGKKNDVGGGDGDADDTPAIDWDD